jgi:hypothetical protein
MTNPLIRVYSDMASAEQARVHLLASGFSSDSIELTARDDEAGPVKSNFAVGNGGAAGRTFDTTSGFNNDIYKDDYATPLQHGNFVLMVDADDESTRQRACDIMDRFGAVDVERRTSR